MLSFRHFLGHETLTREFKEFALLPECLSPFHRRLPMWCRTGQWNETLTRVVEKSLSSYCTQYVEKYRHAFHKTGGELWIGVNDKGICTGIPFASARAKPFQTLDGAVVEWIPLAYESTDLPDVHPRLVQYFGEVAHTSRIQREHSMHYRRWRSEFDVYARRLVDLFRDARTRTEFLSFLSHASPETYAEVTRPGFVMQQKHFREIRDCIEQQQGVYYWMCKWKDDHLSRIRMRKPMKVSRKQRQRAERFGPLRILSKVSEMIPYWMQRNPHLRLYVLKLTFAPVLEVAPKFERGLIVKNGVTTDEPCCVPLDTPSQK